MCKNKMNFDKFQEEVKGRVLDFLSPEFSDAEVSINKVPKNNGLILHGLVVRKPGSRIAPTIYLEPYFAKYEEGMELDDAIRQIASVHEDNPGSAFDDVVSKFMDYEGYVKSHLMISVVNAERNQTLLENVPHTMEEDLAIIYKIVLDIKDDAADFATITVRNEHLAY